MRADQADDYSGSSETDDEPRRDVLSHYNEPFAYLYSDLYSRLVRRLYALGYYDAPTPPPTEESR